MSGTCVLYSSYSHPWMRKHLVNGEALFLVLGKHLDEQVLSGRAHAIPLGLLHVDLFVLDVEERLVLRLSNEGHAPRQQGVEHDAQAPHVGGKVVGLLSHYLRR